MRKGQPASYGKNRTDLEEKIVMPPLPKPKFLEWQSHAALRRELQLDGVDSLYPFQFAQGLMLAVLIATPFWALVGLLIHAWTK